MGKGTLRLAVGADELALGLKDAAVDFLKNDPRVESVTDVGGTAEEARGYTHVGVDGARLVARGQADRALLFCGSGTGVALAANKVRGVRAVTADNPLAVTAAVEIDNAQVLTMGGQVVGPGLATRLIDQWLSLRFDPQGEWGPLARAIEEYEDEMVNGGAA